MANWLNSLPPSGFKGTATELRSSMAAFLQPGESLPTTRKVARTIGAMLKETRYALRRRRLTRARLIIVEPAATAEAVAA